MIAQGEPGDRLESARGMGHGHRPGAASRVGAQRQDLEMRAQLMRDTSLSADLLEERARSLLGFADPRDYVIRMKP